MSVVQQVLQRVYGGMEASRSAARDLHRQQEFVVYARERQAMVARVKAKGGVVDTDPRLIALNAKHNLTAKSNVYTVDFIVNDRFDSAEHDKCRPQAQSQCQTDGYPSCSGSSPSTHLRQLACIVNQHSLSRQDTFHKLTWLAYASLGAKGMNMGACLYA